MNGICSACFLRKHPRCEAAPSVLPLCGNPPSPRGRLQWRRETLRQRPKGAPLRDDFPRSGGICRVATEGVRTLPGEFTPA